MVDPLFNLYLISAVIAAVGVGLPVMFKYMDNRYRRSKDDTIAILAAKTEAQEDMVTYVDNRLQKLEAEIKLLSQMNSIIVKDIDFIKQFIFGREAKSSAAYLTPDTLETQEHKDSPEKGIFKDLWDNEKTERIYTAFSLGHRI